MSLLPDDSDQDVPFGLHESYEHDAVMEFPNDFGAEEIAAELSAPHDPQDILTTGVDIVEDHQFEVALPANCPVKDELNEVTTSDLLMEGEDVDDHFSNDNLHQNDEEACGESENPPERAVQSKKDEKKIQRYDHQEDLKQRHREYQNPESEIRMLNETNDHEMADEHDYGEADEEFEKNLLEPEVDLVEEEQPIIPKRSFSSQSSGQPNVVRRFPGRRPQTNYNLYSNGCSSADEDEDDYDIEPSLKDDRRGCRSLVCDSNSIIIAEMVYRCLICAHVTESIGDAQRHYHRKHMKKDKRKKIPNKSSSPPADRQTSDAYCTRLPDEEADNDEDFSGDLNGFSESGSQSTVTFDVPSSLRQLQQTLTPDSSQANPMTGESSGMSTGKKPGNFVFSPSPADYVPGRNANKSVNQSSQPNPNCTRGGYVTCAVCNITKYYASVQRRYGQFTCMGCAKFFGRFLIKPRRYYCPNLGSCPLDISPRCKACLLLACISTYNIDEKRMKIVNANRPLKKSGQPPPPPRSQVLSSINTHQNSGSNSSSSFAPPPLVKAPASPRQHQSLQQSDEQQLEPRIPPIPNRQQHSIHPQNHQQRLTNPSKPVVRSPLLTSSRSVNSFAPGATTMTGGRKGTGCRQCANCLADDCGQCTYCRDKPKFGGPNTLKKKCIQKKCLLIQPNSNPRMRLIRK